MGVMSAYTLIFQSIKYVFFSNLDMAISVRYFPSGVNENNADELNENPVTKYEPLK